MAAIVVVVVDIFDKHALKLPLTENDDVIEEFATIDSNPTFRNAVLPRTSKRSLSCFNPEVIERVDNGVREFQVIVHDQVFRGVGVRESFAHLLGHPLGSWMFRNGEVGRVAVKMHYDEKDVDLPKRSGWYGEEVGCGDLVPMIAEERFPTLSGALSWPHGS